MKTYSIYYGAARPIVAEGRDECRILEFAEKFQCWHAIGPDLATIQALRAKGCIEIEGDMYRFIYPRGDHD